MKRSWLHLNTATGLRPIKRHGWLARYARAAVEEAVSIESIHARNYGGHRHGGSGNPLLTELSLPSGWRNTLRALKITESYGQFVVETSAGVRTSGATLESALSKMIVPKSEVAGPKFEAVERVFNTIPDAKGPSQIGEGVASA